jgi:hypothetical protein
LLPPKPAARVRFFVRLKPPLRRINDKDGAEAPPLLLIG